MSKVSWQEQLGTSLTDRLTDIAHGHPDGGAISAGQARALMHTLSSFEAAVNGRDREIEALTDRVNELQEIVESKREDLMIMALAQEDPPMPGRWQDELTEQEFETVSFARSAHYQWVNVPFPGRHIVEMVYKLAYALDKMEAKLDAANVRVKQLQDPENTVKRAADLLFKAYRDDVARDVLSSPFK